METHIISRSQNCLKHAFNGTLIAIKEENTFTNVVEDITSCKLINIYRNSSEPKSPCNISVKSISYDGKLRDINTLSNNIYTNDYKEDPRVFIYNNEIYLSYNIVNIDETNNDNITSVKIGYSRLNNNLDVVEEVESFPITTNPWEKNWLFFQHHDSHLYIIYTIYPLKIYRSDGILVKDVDWLHPYDKEKQILYKTSRFLSKNLNSYRMFNKVANLFYETGFQFDIRGGSTPICIDDMYFLFAHSREMPGAKYQFIVVVLDRELNIYKVTHPFDVTTPDHRIVYPAGAVFDKGTRTWFITCGVEDEDQVLVKLNHEFLMSKLLCPEVLNDKPST